MAISNYCTFLVTSVVTHTFMFNDVLIVIPRRPTGTADPNGRRIGISTARTTAPKRLMTFRGKAETSAGSCAWESEGVRTGKTVTAMLTAVTGGGGEQSSWEWHWLQCLHRSGLTNEYSLFAYVEHTCLEF